MDPLDASDTDNLPDDTTDIGDTGAITDASDNPSNGVSASDLFSQLLGTAGVAYSANQLSAAQIAAANAATTTAAQQPILTQLTAATGLSSSTLLLIGIALVFVVALRK